MSEADPEQEAIESLRRTATTTFMAVSRAAERLTRQREQQVREAEAGSVQRTQELPQRLEAEKATARAVTAETRLPDSGSTQR